MKKLLVLLICGALFAASCTKQNTPVPNSSYSYYVKSSDWVAINGGKTDTVGLNAPQINQTILQSGDVMISFTFDGGISYAPLPYVADNINYSYTYTKGEILLYAQSVDGTQIATLPQILTIKMLVVSSR